LDFDFSPAPIACRVAWPISQYVLISKLEADFCSDIRQFIEVTCSENTTAGHLRDFAQKGWAIKFFKGPAAVFERIKNADRIKLGIGFFHKPLDIAFLVAAMIIASVGQDEKGTLGVVCTSYLAENGINSIEQSSSTLRRGKHQATLQVFDTVGKRTRQLGAFIEANQKKLVLWIGSLKELDCCLPGFAKF